MARATSRAGAAGGESTKTARVGPAGDSRDAMPGWQQRVVDRSLGKATQRSLDRGATLIQAAATLLERTGGDGFTVQDVADEAGQSLRSFYQHFGSKDDLLLALFEEAMHTYADFISRSIASFDDPMERLAVAVYNAASLPQRNTTGVGIGLSKLHLQLAQVGSDRVAAAQEPLTELFRLLVTDAVGSGGIGPCDPEATSYLLVALNNSFIINSTLGNEYGVRAPTVDEFVRFCLHGVNAHTTEEFDASLASAESHERVRLRPGARHAEAAKLT